MSITKVAAIDEDNYPDKYVEETFFAGTPVSSGANPFFLNASQHDIFIDKIILRPNGGYTVVQTYDVMRQTATGTQTRFCKQVPTASFPGADTAVEMTIIRDADDAEGETSPVTDNYGVLPAGHSLVVLCGGAGGTFDNLSVYVRYRTRG